MLLWSVYSFCIAALGGIILAVKALKGEEPPMLLAIIHGVIGAIGLVLLTLVVVNQDEFNQLAVSLMIFIIVALGGFGLFSFHLRKLTLPKPLVIIHALGAVTALVVLLLAI